MPAFNDSLSMSDDALLRLHIIEATSDTMSMSDALSEQGGTEPDVQPEDTMAFSDAIVTSWAYNTPGAMSDSLTISDRIQMSMSQPAFGIGAKVLIDNGLGFIDYTRYVDEKTIVVTDSINVPTLAEFSCHNIGDAFEVPKRNAYVKILGTGLGGIIPNAAPWVPYPY